MQGGLVLVDAPGTNDPAPLHCKQLNTACEVADHIILTAEKNLGIGQTLTAMRENGVLRRFLEPDAKAFGLSILHTRRGAPGDSAAEDAAEVKQSSVDVRASATAGCVRMNH